jgi:hypothetical protein
MPVPSAVVTAWKARAGHRSPSVVNPSAWEKTPPTMVTIHIKPASNNTTPATPTMILILYLLARTGHFGLVKDSSSHGLHDHPQRQHRKQAMKQISRPHFGAQARDLAAEHVRHAVRNSDQPQKPGDDRAYPPPHLPHLPVIKRVSPYLWFPRGPGRPAARSEAAWDGPSPARTRRRPAVGAVPARRGTLERCQPHRAVARFRS